jgi:cytochrome c5
MKGSPVSRLTKSLACGVVAALLSLSVPVVAAPPTETAEPAGSVAAKGVTLRSESLSFPASRRIFPGGARANIANANCLTCHSAGMVLTQPKLSEADWTAEVNKMRNVYKAPIQESAVPAIVAYLATLNPGGS